MGTALRWVKVRVRVQPAEDDCGLRESKMVNRSLFFILYLICYCIIVTPRRYGLMEPGYADNAFGAQAHWSPLF
jgi:hypothetical protein